MTSPPFHDLRLVQSGCLCKLHFRWCVLKNRRVELADRTPPPGAPDPDIMSCILMGNCSRWFTHAFIFWTKARNLVGASGSTLPAAEVALSETITKKLKSSSNRKECKRINYFIVT